MPNRVNIEPRGIIGWGYADAHGVLNLGTLEDLRRDIDRRENAGGGLTLVTGPRMSTNTFGVVVDGRQCGQVAAPVPQNPVQVVVVPPKEPRRMSIYDWLRNPPV